MSCCAGFDERLPVAEALPAGLKQRQPAGKPKPRSPRVTTEAADAAPAASQAACSPQPAGPSPQVGHRTGAVAPRIPLADVAVSPPGTGGSPCTHHSAGAAHSPSPSSSCRQGVGQQGGVEGQTTPGPEHIPPRLWDAICAVSARLARPGPWQEQRDGAASTAASKVPCCIRGRTGSM